MKGLPWSGLPLNMACGLGKLFNFQSLVFLNCKMLFVDCVAQCSAEDTGQGRTRIWLDEGREGRGPDNAQMFSLSISVADGICHFHDNTEGENY